MRLIAARPDDPRWAQVARLIREAFAYMEPILGHPAGASRVTADQLAAACGDGPVFLVLEGDIPFACLFCRPSRDIPSALYIGWLAVAQHARGRGLARRLVKAAAKAARANGFAALTLDTGKPLTGLQATLARLGFALTRPLEETDGEVVTMLRPL